ncbi:hypothetical protein [Micromonospora sp. WMMD1102]
MAQVPLASTTARASRSAPEFSRSSSGAFSRPAVRSRSMPSRVTARTRVR